MSHGTLRASNLKSLARKHRRGCVLVAGKTCFALTVHDEKLIAGQMKGGVAIFDHPVVVNDDEFLPSLNLEQVQVMPADPARVNRVVLDGLITKVLGGTTGSRRDAILSCCESLISLERVLLDDGPGAFVTDETIIVWPAGGIGVNSLHFAFCQAPQADHVPASAIQHWTGICKLSNDRLHQVRDSLKGLALRPEIRSFRYRAAPQSCNSGP